MDVRFTANRSLEKTEKIRRIRKIIKNLVKNPKQGPRIFRHQWIDATHQFAVPVSFYRHDKPVINIEEIKKEDLLDKKIINKGLALKGDYVFKRYTFEREVDC